MPIIKPPVLKKGDTVGIPSPSSKPPSAWITPAVERLRASGFQVKLGPCLTRTSREGFLAASDKMRADEMNQMFRDPDVDAVLCARGGYGSIRILPYLDYELIKEHPKILMGMSDVTSLLLAVHRKTGLVTFHGPGALGSMTGEFTPFTQKSITAALTSTDPIGVVRNPPDALFIQTVTGGRARGRLTGGNLNLMIATLATPYEIDTSQRIVFFEVPGLRPWQIDRHLVHLKLAGKLGQANGFVAGEMVGSEPYERAIGEYWTSYPGSILDHHLSSTVEEVVSGALREMNKPAIYGLVCGHGKHKVVMPIGVMADLDADNGTLTITESATVR